jgi:hypothetical protein
MEPGMSTSTPAPEDGFDFVRKMWGNMGFGLPGMVTPSLDVDELERRITDLKAVEGWLKMNLGMLQMNIQGLEVQRATLAAMQAMSQTARDNPEANPFANPALWSWPFGTPTESKDATGAASPSAAPKSGTDAPASPQADTPQKKAPRKPASPA